MFSFKNLLVSAICAPLALTTASAEFLKFEFTPASGMPFCANGEDFKEMMAAILAKDTAKIDSMKNCVNLSAGQRIAVIQEMFALEGIRVVKARVFGSKGNVEGVGFLAESPSKAPATEKVAPKPDAPVVIEIQP